MQTEYEHRPTLFSTVSCDAAKVGAAAPGGDHAGMSRSHGRADDQIRPLRLTRGFTEVAEGSVLIECGRTRVLCTASVEPGVPAWLEGKGRGWVTAEYAMLPSSTSPRKPRAIAKGRRDGRSVEIGRLIGRSLRAGVELRDLVGISIVVDCEVLVADGGTRTAAISGAYVALVDACRKLLRDGRLETIPLRPIAAVSVGLVDGRVLVDLDYPEDARAEVDMNVVMDGDGKFVEVQGSAEAGTFTREQHDLLLDGAAAGIRQILGLQQAALDQPLGET